MSLNLLYFYFQKKRLEDGKRFDKTFAKVDLPAPFSPKISKFSFFF